MTQHSPEWALFLLCARPILSSPAVEQLNNLVTQVVDFERVLDLAQRHRTLPLLHKHLEVLPPKQIPEKFKTTLGNLYLRNVARSSVLVEALHHILAVVKLKGAAPVAYKGPVLAQEAYGDISLRQYDDLDILLPKKDIPELSDWLRNEGYEPQLTLPAGHSDLYLQSERDWIYTCPDTGVFLDVNSAVVPRYFGLSLRYEDLAPAARPFTLLGRDVQIPSSEDMLLILCLHGSYHAWERVSWVSDVAALLETHLDLDWDLVWSRAASANMLRCLATALFLVSRLLAIPLPAEIRTRIERDPLSKKLAERCAGGLETGQRSGQKWSFHLHVLPGLAMKTHYVRNNLLVPTIGDWRTFRFRPSMRGLYWILRPFRILFQRILLRR